MCLGLPGRIVELQPGSTVAKVDVVGVVREIDVGVLDGSLAPGDCVLVHSGFALQRLTPQESRDARAALGVTTTDS